MKNQSGFTLIELSISTIIFGLLMVAFIGIYKPYVAQQKIEKTENRLVDIYAALESYKADRGFYPCPASLTSARNQANYGFASDCTDTSTAVGVCSIDGYCVRSSTRALTNPRVRVGAVPFRDLNIEESDTYDGYGSRYYLVMTENLAISTTEYDDNIGGIDVVDGRGVSLTAGTPSSAKFVLFSAGINKVGGYNVQGNEVVSCATASAYNGADKQNCEPISDAVFAFTGEVGEGLADEMDDFVMFDDAAIDQVSAGWRTGNPANLDFESNNESVNDVITSGSVKIGSFEDDPRQELDVSGDLSDMRTEDALVAETGFCNYTNSITGAADGCFTVANLQRTCPAGEYVTGLGPDDGFNIICSPIAFRCGDDEMITGVDGDGLPICSPIPTTTPPPSGSDGTSDLTVTSVVINEDTGDIIGTIGSDGEVIDGSGNVVGQIGANGTIVDGGGNVIGSLATGGAVTDGSGNVIGLIGEGGNIVGSEGNIVGVIGAGGTVTDLNGEVIGTLGSTNAGALGAGSTVEGLIGEGGTVIDSNGDAIGTIGEGGTIVDGSGDVIGTLGTGATVTDGIGNVIGEVGVGGAVTDENGDIIGFVGAGGTVIDGSGSVIGEVAGNTTANIVEETDQSCSEEIRENSLQCPDKPGSYYSEYEIYSCANSEWIDQGNNRTTACCDLGPDPVVTSSETDDFGSPPWICGPYGDGIRTVTKYPNFGNCSLGNPDTNWSCECLDPGIGFENPADYRPDENYIQVCAEREFTYPPASDTRCVSRTEGTLLYEGSVKPGSFQWTLNGASPDNVDPIGSQTRQEGDSCYEAGARNRCATQNPVSGSNYQYYNGCTCEIIEQSSPIVCK